MRRWTTLLSRAALAMAIATALGACSALVGVGDVPAAPAVDGSLPANDSAAPGDDAPPGDGATSPDTDATQDVAAEVTQDVATDGRDSSDVLEVGTSDATKDGSAGDGNPCPDQDGDGWTTCAGDCDDGNPLVNPCAFDTNDTTDPVGRDSVDNDCDGTVDNLVTCETGLTAGHDTTPGDYAHAVEICDNPKCPRLTKSIWFGTNIPTARRITSHMGTGHFAPHAGSFMAFLSTGVADDETDTPGFTSCPGTDFQTTFSNPAPLPAAQNTNPCGTGVDESTVAVHDFTELQLTLQAPTNANAFEFDFAMFSAEYPVYVCQGFNDTFLTMMVSDQFPSGSQIAFDSNGHHFNVNNAFFTDCNSCTNCVVGPSGLPIDFTHLCTSPISTLAGTSYDLPIANSTNPASQCNENKGSGGTDWLSTTAPVPPGQSFTLSWIIFDESDGILDTSVILDNFRWHSAIVASPVTSR
jgi:hypothetical protein